MMCATFVSAPQPHRSAKRPQMKAQQAPLDNEQGNEHKTHTMHSLNHGSADSKQSSHTRMRLKWAWSRPKPKNKTTITLTDHNLGNLHQLSDRDETPSPVTSTPPTHTGPNLAEPSRATAEQAGASTRHHGVHHGFVSAETKPSRQRMIRDRIRPSPASQAAFHRHAGTLETVIADFARRILERGIRDDSGEPVILCTSIQNAIDDSAGSEPHLMTIEIGGKEKYAKLVEASLQRYGHCRTLKYQKFELKTTFNPQLGYVAAGGTSSVTASSRTKIYIDRRDGDLSLCGAMILLQPAPNMQIPPAMCTCGGLISVDGRLYALSVAHPLRGPTSSSLTQEPHTGTNAQSSSQSDARSGQHASGYCSTNGHADYDEELAALQDDILFRLWQPFGRVAHKALCDSDTIPLNSDWLLIEVDHGWLLPNMIANGTPHGRFVTTHTTQRHIQGTGEHCELYTNGDLLEGRVLPERSYLTIGNAHFRALRIALRTKLKRGDSGTWVVRNGILLGVVIARAKERASQHIALVLDAEDMLKAISNACNGAMVRLPTRNEQEILTVQQHQDHSTNACLSSFDCSLFAELYARDIYERFEKKLVPSQPPPADHFDAENDLSPFLAIGRAFPLSTLARAIPKYRRKWSVRIWWPWPGSHRVAKATLALAERLLQFEGGENFAVLLQALRIMLSSDTYVIWEFVNKYLDCIEFPAARKPSIEMISEMCITFWPGPRRWRLWPTPGFQQPRQYTGSPVDFARLLAMLDYAQRSNSFMICGGEEAFARTVMTLSNIPHMDLDHQPWHGLDLDTFPRAFFEPRGEPSAHVVPSSELYEHLEMPRNAEVRSIAAIAYDLKEIGIDFRDVRVEDMLAYEHSGSQSTSPTRSNTPTNDRSAIARARARARARTNALFYANKVFSSDSRQSVASEAGRQSRSVELRAHRPSRRVRRTSRGASERSSRVFADMLSEAESCEQQPKSDHQPQQKPVAGSHASRADKHALRA